VTATSQQLKAIVEPGNVLMMAGAGTGKTHTLVERCLRCLLDETSPSDLDEILMVTFTEAAAAEMRQRIRGRLEQELLANPGNRRVREQLGLFETAHIGTLHSFCLQLVRQHFYQLELDPQSSVITAEEASLLALEELDQLLREHYAGNLPDSPAVQQVITAQGDGSDQSIRSLILRLHSYSQTLPDPVGWYSREIKRFSQAVPSDWVDWLQAALADFRERWLPFLRRLAPFNGLAEQSLGFIQQLPAAPDRLNAAPILAKIIGTSTNCPQGKKGAWLDPLEDFYDEARFLASLGPKADQPDPLNEDWKWVHSYIATILKLTREFHDRFARAKRELAVLDFHDLEQFALQLLWDHQASGPTKLAEDWQQKFRYVLVDEYQDINAAQDKILQALSRSGARANRFLVGDVKQSIYRFRLAAPHIFQEYARSWSQGLGSVIPLADNFRSREGILDFVNSFFELVMRAEVGGVPYGKDARLSLGAAKERQALGIAAGQPPPVELHLRIKRRANRKDQPAAGPDTDAELNDLEEASKEARLAAFRLRDLRSNQYQVWDEETKAFRAVDWKDMAILLRSPANKAESYAKEFSRLNVPLAVARNGFYESTEISDLLSLLKSLDNPLQDVPLLAVLRSPLGGFALDELATIRLTAKGRFWTALLQGHRHASSERARQSTPHEEPASPSPEPTSNRKDTTAIWDKASLFLDRFSRWRRLVRQASLSTCLERVLVETHYAEWLLTQPRGEQRYGNLQRLLSMAQKFDQFQRQGLFRFLRFIEAQQSAEAEPPIQAVAEENAIRLMSIHQSKGLEFPVVLIADTGKVFNLSDLRAEVLLDEVYGICPQIKPPDTGKRYPSLPCWLARRRQRKEILGEELRLLYVATTRARDLLLFTSSISESKLEKVWNQGGEDVLDPVQNANSFADWLGFWFSQRATFANGQSQGATELVRWFIHEDAALLAPPTVTATAEPLREPLLPADPPSWRELQNRLSWKYPFPGATTRPAKSSVSLLRQRAAAHDEEEPGSLSFDFQRPRLLSAGKASGADAGSATHAFLQLVPLGELGNHQKLQAAAERLVQAKALTPEEAELIDFKDLARFWNSELGHMVQAHPEYIQRELAFTARLSLPELNAVLGEPAETAGNDNSDFIVIQGVADLALLMPKEIRLIDFKTDNFAPAQLAERTRQYGPQLALYALALSKIYQRPVAESWLYFLSLGQAVALHPK
jgi:ATP-dependent helicase/nuclease subunit A